MSWIWAVGVLASSFLGTAHAYGTTVSIAISRCPTSPTLATTTASSSSRYALFSQNPQQVLTASSPTATPYFLVVEQSLAKRADAQYVSADGTLSNDPGLALAFQFNTLGQLSTNLGLISTSGTVPDQRFAPSFSVQAISTTFSISIDQTLSWINDAFVNRQALFCSFNSILEVYFDGIPPDGCNPVVLGVVAAKDVVPMPSSSTSSTSSLASFSLSQTMQPSSFMYSASTPQATSSTTLTYASSTSPALSSTTTEYPAPTTTGEPNCFDGAGFDGSVNAGYLILCDTELPGFDLVSVPALNLGECINACNEYAPSDEGRCVAVEYDILAATNPCNLKSDIGAIDRGGNPFAQAAVVVNEPYSPPVVFDDGSNSSPSSTTTTGTLSTTSSSVIPTATLSSTISTSQAPRAVSSSLSSPPPPPPPMSSQGGPSTSSAPSIQLTRTPQASTTTSVTASMDVLPPSSTGYPRPTTSILCPTYNHQVLNVNGDNYDYEVECATALEGSMLAGNSSVASSLQNCIRFCTLYNVALPFQCLGVNYLPSVTPGSPNCNLYGSVTGTSYSFGIVDAARLIYEGYPVPADPIYGQDTPSSTTPNEAPTNNPGTTPPGQSAGPATIGSSSAATTVPEQQPIPLAPPGTSSTTTTNAVDSTTTTTTTTTTTRASTSASTGQVQSSATIQVTSSRTSTLSIPSSVVSTTSLPPPTTSTVATPTTQRSVTSTTPTSACPAAPTNTAGDTEECTPPSGQPACYSYNFTSRLPTPNQPRANNFSNYEIECSTSFSGAALQAILATSLSDCIYWCEYANTLAANSCIGVTYTNGEITTPPTNNCVRYSSITCASRGNTTFDSARLLYAGYPSMVDYASSFNC